MKLSQVLSTLSDEQSFEILQKVVKTEDGGKGVKINKADYKTPRKYYNRVKKLRDASQIRKATKGKGYEPTLLGKILYDLLQTAEAACDLSWRLTAIDEIFRNQPEVPQEEKEALARRLIPDPRIQRLLFPEEAAKDEMK